ncbi:MAG: CDP-diacylglycerol--glycerol-3-phosphate 3-phosphatidyltransferase [Spirochaetales bacterium]|nr:CDP-diacylglycerol--glycerol-3-phosphate 3-phosphatidyltransferase [Spirochaetales bacterium]
MNLPNKLTISRIIAAPVFFVIFSIPEWTGRFARTSTIALILLFVLMELSDLFDGIIARKYNLVTDMGKVMDPFADVISRMTFFLCFVSIGIMPVWMITVFIYRELSITFYRMYLIQKGQNSMAASRWGKNKAISYTVSGVGGLFYVVCIRFGLFPEQQLLFLRILNILFIISVAMAVASFISYMPWSRKIK